MIAAQSLPFRPIAPRDIPERAPRHRPSRYVATLRQFMVSRALAIEIDLDGRRPNGVAKRMTDVIREVGLAGQVRCYQRQCRVFLSRAET
jgi:hypothetical protein